VTRAVVRHRYAEWPHLVELGTPEPGDGELLVRVVATSLNTADLDVALGRPPIARVSTGARQPRRPYLGIDVAGVVEAVGSNVTAFAAGDAVWGDVFGPFGAFAERVVAPAKAFSPKPPGVPFEAAACVPHSGLLALQGLTRHGGVGAGDRVLINGGGGCVGPFAIQIAKAWDAEVTAVDHGAKHDLLRRAGADHVVDHTTTDCTRLGERFDFVLDIAANRGPLAYRRVLAPDGRYVLVARNLAGYMRAAVVGGRRFANLRWQPSDPGGLATIAGMIERGEVTPIVDRVCSLDQIPDELRRLHAGEAQGKIVVRVDPDTV
jgi:NADPH:quinone reductase-like Zn-dependent oxidoreductase